jgi:hypothetical protein
MFWFQTYEYFEIDDQSEKKAPKVEF